MLLILYTVTVSIGGVVFTAIRRHALGHTNNVVIRHQVFTPRAVSFMQSPNKYPFYSYQPSSLAVLANIL